MLFVKEDIISVQGPFSYSIGAVQMYLEKVTPDGTNIVSGRFSFVSKLILAKLLMFSTL